MRFLPLVLLLISLTFILAGCGAETVPATPTVAIPTSTSAATTTAEPAETVAPTHTAQAASTATPTPTQQTTAGWTQILPTNSGPSQRYDHSTLADPIRQQLVVFGGRGNGTFGDTWLFDLTKREWREVKSAGPSPRFGHAMVYDAANRRMLLVMGQGADGFFNDVWAFDLDNEAWTQLKENQVAEDQPRPRYGQSAALHKDGRVLVSHGFSDQGRFDDTWAFDPATAKWANITPSNGPIPLKRCLHELAYDAQDDKLLMFGGCSSGFGPCPQGDLWSLDLKNGAWTELTPSGEKPAARSNPSVVYDQAERKLLLFGGKGESGALADTWLYGLQTGVWEPVPSDIGPGARSSQGTTYDQQSRKVYIFGGQTTDGLSADVWAYDF